MRPLERNSRLSRVGFTLIEMLMVFLIIAILVGLLIPVVASARASAQRAAEISEMQLLATAITDFKNRYGVYPPSTIILREDGDYVSPSLSGMAPVVGPAAGTAGLNPNDQGENTAVFDEDLSIQYLRRIFPQMIIHVRKSTDPPNPVIPAEIGDINNDGVVNASDFYDWNGDGLLYYSGSSSPQVHYLQGDECLVFFLGGIPAGEVLTGTGTGSRLNSGPPGTLGFGKKPAWPTERIVGGTTSTSRDGPFYEFKQRLMDRDNDQFYELIPHRNAGRAPYVYFSAYEGSGYRPDDLDLPSEPNGTPTYSLDFGVLWRLTASYPAAYLRGSGTPANPYYLHSPGPNPYTSSPSDSTAAGWSPQSPRYQKPDSFQLISPGSDLAYGPGGELPIPSSDPLRDGDKDNLATFFGGELKDMPR